MTKRKNDEPLKEETNEKSRRDFLKGTGVVAGGLAAAAAPGLASAQQQGTTQNPPSQNPYGPRPGGGISLPDYYKPWPAIKNRNTYLPGTEILPKNEMRISFMGSTPFPVSQEQSGTCMLVELGNDTAQPRRFFFDMGWKHAQRDRNAGSHRVNQRPLH